MQFHQYRERHSPHSNVARAMGWRDLEDEVKWALVNGLNASVYGAMFEHGWRKLRRPYYNVYPCVIEPLSKISLDFAGSLISKPSGLNYLVLRFPTNGAHGLSINGMDLRTVAISFHSGVNDDAKIKFEEPMFTVSADFGEEEEIAPGIVFAMPSVKAFAMNDTWISQRLSSSPMNIGDDPGIEFPDEFINRIINLSVAICQLGDDTSIIEPDFLTSDLHKITPDNWLQYHGKAINRGKFGFNLGKHVEVIPHYRRPHPALMWTGKGRAIPRIVFRKGSLVHREVVEKIPTGKVDVPNISQDSR